MKMPKLLRTIYTVQFDTRLDAWVVMAGSVAIAAYKRRIDAEQTGAMFAKVTHNSARIHAGPAATHRLCSQLRTRNRAGQWGRERTYGADPVRSKG